MVMFILVGICYIHFWPMIIKFINYKIIKWYVYVEWKFWSIDMLYYNFIWHFYLMCVCVFFFTLHTQESTCLTYSHSILRYFRILKMLISSIFQDFELHISPHLIYYRESRFSWYCTFKSLKVCENQWIYVSVKVESVECTKVR